MSGIKGNIKRIARRLKDALAYLTKLTISTAYNPNNLVSGKHGMGVEVYEVRIDNISYQLVNVCNGRIFTDRGRNVSILSRKSLVPSVSWQHTYDHGGCLSDIENHLLTRELLIDQFPRRIEGTVISLLSGGPSNNNYYHWLYDALPRLYIAKSIIKNYERIHYLIPENTYSFQEETLDLLGIPVPARISSKDCRHLQATNLIATSHPNPHEGAPSWVVRFLRESLMVTSPNTLEEKYIYISRGDSLNGRRLLNEDYLRRLLESVGFRTYRLSELTVSQQISLFSKAKMIVGMHGAGFANLTFASKGAVVYELFSDRYQPDMNGKGNQRDWVDMYERVSRILELDYHKVICRTVEGENSDWSTNLPPDDVLRLDCFISESDSMAILNHAKYIATGVANELS
jgi:capsular polysaccharide biosynthesis protein